MPRSIDDIFPLDAAGVSLTVSVTSNRVALPSGRQAVRITNLGALPVFLRPGSNSVTASVGNLVIAGGTSGLFSRKIEHTHVAGISQSSIVTLNIAVGDGKFH